MSELTKRLRKWQYEYEITDFGDAADRIDKLEECLLEALPHIQGNGGAWEDMANRASNDKAKEIGKFKAAEAYALRDTARALLEE